MSESGSIEDHLDALRNANDGWAITVWKDGGWKLWRTLDAKYAEGDPDWLATLAGADIESHRADLAASGHEMTLRASITRQGKAR
jgi:hypothetical protein